MPGTTSLFGYQYRHNLQEGFPLLTTKKVYWKGVAVELLWIIQGNTNVKYLETFNLKTFSGKIFPCVKLKFKTLNNRTTHLYTLNRAKFSKVKLNDKELCKNKFNFKYLNSRTRCLLCPCKECKYKKQPCLNCSC